MYSAPSALSMRLRSSPTESAAEISSSTSIDPLIGTSEANIDDSKNELATSSVRQVHRKRTKLDAGYPSLDHKGRLLPERARRM